MDERIDIDELEYAVERLVQFCRVARARALLPHGKSKIKIYTTLKTIVGLHRLREKIIGPELFSDPAWNILLDLAVSYMEERQVSISSLCTAAAVPATTALRWIASMTDQGLLVRSVDPMDGRRIFVTLSDRMIAAMEAFAVEAGAMMSYD